MWKPDGPLVAPDSLGSLEPVDVLFEYDCEPLTFVVHDPGGHLLLAHWLDFSDGTTRYLISAIDSQILNDLRSNRLDLQGALRQPRCWTRPRPTVQALHQKVLVTETPLFDQALEPGLDAMGNLADILTRGAQFLGDHSKAGRLAAPEPVPPAEDRALAGRELRQDRLELAGLDRSRGGLRVCRGARAAGIRRTWSLRSR
jgi:hypothetical protein